MQKRAWIEYMKQKTLREELTIIEIHNYKNRNYMHFRDESISTKVNEQEKIDILRIESGTIASNLRNYIRLLLLEDLQTMKYYAEESLILYKEDFCKLAGVKTWEGWENIPSQERNLKTQEIKALEPKDVMGILELEFSVATKLTGYEKEIFILRCQAVIQLAAHVLRIGVRLLGRGILFDYQPQIELQELL